MMLAVEVTFIRNVLNVRIWLQWVTEKCRIVSKQAIRRGYFTHDFAFFLRKGLPFWTLLDRCASATLTEELSY